MVFAGKTNQNKSKDDAIELYLNLTGFVCVSSSERNGIILVGKVYSK